MDIEDWKTERINKRTVNYSRRIVIKESQLSHRGFILTSDNEDEYFTLNIHQDTIRELNNWIPIKLDVLGNQFSKLIMTKFPEYRLNQFQIQVDCMSTHSNKVELDILEIY